MKRVCICLLLCCMALSLCACRETPTDDPVAYKPVIYLYPEAETDVHVEVEPDGALATTYPAYGIGWDVTASPDGTLTDADGRHYPYLFWEGTIRTEYDFSEGFCVKGEDSAAFLEDALPKLGLSEPETREFIVYWLPILEASPYNLISFQSGAYTDHARLDVTPQPDTVIRVYMAYRPLSAPAEIAPQTLTAPERAGFTVVEWGGGQG